MSLSKRFSAATVLSLFFLAGTIQADTIFLASTDANVHIGDFGTLDIDTGVYTPLGNNTVTLAGIGVLGGSLYGAAYNTANGTLYSINPADGSLNAVGSSTVTYLAFGVANGMLYAVGTDNNLYSIDSGTGAATVVGATGVANSSANWTSLSNGFSSLYYDVQDALYSLNLTTGAATLIGCEGSGTIQAVCSGPQMGAMGGNGGVLYGIDNVVNQSYTINTGTALATQQSAAVTGNYGHFNGLSAAPEQVSQTPEPGTVVLLGAAFGLISLRRRR